MSPYQRGDADLVEKLARINGVELQEPTSSRRPRIVVDGFLGSFHARSRDDYRWNLKMDAGRAADTIWFRRWAASHNQTCSPFQIGLKEVDVDLAVTISTNIKQKNMQQNAPTLKALRDSIHGAADLARTTLFVLAHPPEADEWGQLRSGYEDMVLTLAAADFPAPPVPIALRPAVVKLAPWMWATYEADGMKLYLAEFDGEPVRQNRFACAHLGHGVNSYFMSLELGWNGVHIGGRIPYGGAYSDAVSDRQAVAATWMGWQRELDLLQGWDPDGHSVETAMARAARNKVRQASKKKRAR